MSECDPEILRDGEANARSIRLCSRRDALADVAPMTVAGRVVAAASGWPDLVVAALIAGRSLSTALHVVRWAHAQRRSERTRASHPRHVA